MEGIETPIPQTIVVLKDARPATGAQKTVGRHDAVSPHMPIPMKSPVNQSAEKSAPNWNCP
jgi:hypothetical protein